MPSHFETASGLKYTNESCSLASVGSDIIVANLNAASSNLNSGVYNLDSPGNSGNLVEIAVPQFFLYADVFLMHSTGATSPTTVQPVGFVPLRRTVGYYPFDANGTGSDPRGTYDGYWVPLTNKDGDAAAALNATDYVLSGGLRIYAPTTWYLAGVTKLMIPCAGSGVGTICVRFTS